MSSLRMYSAQVIFGILSLTMFLLSAEKKNIDCFDVQVNRQLIRLHRVDWSNITPLDKKNLSKLVPSLLELWNIHGFAAAAVQKGINITNDVIIDDLKTLFNNNLTNMPDGQKIQYQLKKRIRVLLF